MNNEDHHDEIIEKLQSLSVVEFLALGTDGLAYIKSNGVIDDVESFTVYAADGTHIASGPDIQVLKAIANRQSLTPMSTQ